MEMTPQEQARRLAAIQALERMGIGAPHATADAVLRAIDDAVVSAPFQRCDECGLDVRYKTKGDEAAAPGAEGVGYHECGVCNEQIMCAEEYRDAHIACIESLQRQVAEEERESEHYLRLAFVDAGANPPVTWKERAIKAEAKADLLDAQYDPLVEAFNKSQAKVAELSAALARLIESADLLAGELSDPGAEALAAIYCAKAMLASTPTASPDAGERRVIVVFETPEQAQAWLQIMCEAPPPVGLTNIYQPLTAGEAIAPAVQESPLDAIAAAGKRRALKDAYHEAEADATWLRREVARLNAEVARLSASTPAVPKAEGDSAIDFDLTKDGP